MEKETKRNSTPRYGQWKMIIYLSEGQFWAVSVLKYQISNRKNVIMITREIKYLCFWVFADIFADSASAFIFIWSATCALVSLHPFDRDNLMLDYMPYYGNWPSIDCQNQIIVTVRLTYSCLVIRRVFKTRHRSKLMNKWCIFGIFTLEMWTRRSKIENWRNNRPKLPRLWSSQTWNSTWKHIFEKLFASKHGF